MIKKITLVFMVGSAAAPLTAGAEPYSTVVGSQKVTSVRRSPTKGVVTSREDLLKAVRDAVPIIVVAPEPTKDNRIK